MCVCEKFVARVPLVNQFLLHEEFSGTFFDSAILLSAWPFPYGDPTLVGKNFVPNGCRNS